MLALLQSELRLYIARETQVRIIVTRRHKGSDILVSPKQLLKLFLIVFIH